MALQLRVVATHGHPASLVSPSGCRKGGGAARQLRPKVSSGGASRAGQCRSWDADDSLGRLHVKPWTVPYMSKLFLPALMVFLLITAFSVVLKG